ncbi:alpha/beta fold hydrolase [Mycobacterium botniense]|uniref:Alpha/beta hydrolase n=1 Tax=Mycobacterium botniense TaxID=84962 RepID=A0A7I9XT29_9MYCO|nr:alpha/beta hydrolase [Mycobacterium botniense]GFG73159.1 alpha/beta hydrolase [Mycobacterium botniense]
MAGEPGADPPPGPVRSGIARNGAVQLYYEDMGEPDRSAVLLIMGLGAQLLLWPTGFCEKLIGQGLRVIRYDNRDVGLSSKTEYRGRIGPLVPRLIRSWLGLPSPAIYSLEDMAQDAAAVLDHLGIGAAHIVGASMGGMIAQIFAARFPQRTRSLAVIFSSNNRPLLPPPHPRALAAIITGPPPGSPREVIVDNAVRVSKIIGGPRYPKPEAQVRREAAQSYDRSYHPWGITRHFDAVLGSGSLARYDRQITAPTVVIHGRADKLMRPSGGRAIARAIRGARLVLVDGMGHELPEQLWDLVVGELKRNFAEAS